MLQHGYLPRLGLETDPLFWGRSVCLSGVVYGGLVLRVLFVLFLVCDVSCFWSMITQGSGRSLVWVYHIYGVCVL